MEQFSEQDHVRCEGVASFFRKDGCTTQIDYRSDVWVLYVWRRGAGVE
jgi:hypothetical protein